MLINEKDAIERLDSPLNLINRLRGNNNSRSNAMGLFVPGKSKQDNKPKNGLVPSGRNEIFNPFKSSEIEGEEERDEPSGKKDDPEQQQENLPNVDNLISNAETQIKLAQAHDLALETLTNSVKMLGTKLDDIKPEKLPSVISATSKVVEGIRRERNEAAKSRSGNRDVHLHFYSPVQRKEEDYQVIEVG